MHQSCTMLWSRPYPKWSSRLQLPPAGFFSECLSTGIPKFCSNNTASTPALRLSIILMQRQAESADEARLRDQNIHLPGAFSDAAA